MNWSLRDTHPERRQPQQSDDLDTLFAAGKAAREAEEEYRHIRRQWERATNAWCDADAFGLIHNAMHWRHRARVLDAEMDAAKARMAATALELTRVRSTVAVPF